MVTLDDKVSVLCLFLLCLVFLHLYLTLLYIYQDFIEKYSGCWVRYDNSF